MVRQLNWLRRTDPGTSKSFMNDIVWGRRKEKEVPEVEELVTELGRKVMKNKIREGIISRESKGKSLFPRQFGRESTSEAASIPTVLTG